MKVRDSGMPEQIYWEGLFDIGGVLDGLQIDREIDDAVEVGCGYGTFSLPVAQRIRGTLHSFDIEPDMVEITRSRAATAEAKNLRVAARDIIANGFGLPQQSVDAVLLFNILHAEDPGGMLRAAADVVRPGGRVLAIHWRSDVKTPRGPDLSIRPKPEQIAHWAHAAGLQAQPSLLLPPWHFGIVSRR
jgi:SAM-dependent methyltransferase